MKKLFPLIICVLFSGISCTQQSTELNNDQKATIITEVTSQMDGIQSAINKLDINAWSEFWSKDEFISVNSGINYFDNRSVWIDSVKYWWSKLESRTIESQKRVITPLVNNLALAINIVKGEDLLKSGEKNNFMALITEIWKKEPDGWMIINFHESWQGKIEE